MQEMRLLLANFGDWPGYSVRNDEINPNKVCLIYKCPSALHVCPKGTVVCMLVIAQPQPHAMVISQLTASITTMKLKVEEHYFCISAIKL